MTFNLKRVAAALAGAAMIVTPIAASAAPVGPTQTSVGRASTPTAHRSRIGADVSRGTLISIGILAALIVIVLVATGGDDDNDTPNSR